MWTYYRHDYGGGVWVLFREDGGREEVFHRREGWVASTALSDRRAKGEIDREDIIGEDEARALIAGLVE